MPFFTKLTLKQTTLHVAKIVTGKYTKTNTNTHTHTHTERDVTTGGIVKQAGNNVTPVSIYYGKFKLI